MNEIKEMDEQKPRFCVVYQGSEAVDVSPGISEKEQPDFVWKPCLKTQFFATEECLTDWIRSSPLKDSGVIIYELERLTFTLLVDLKPVE